MLARRLTSRIHTVSAVHQSWPRQRVGTNYQRCWQKNAKQSRRWIASKSKDVQGEAIQPRIISSPGGNLASAFGMPFVRSAAVIGLSMGLGDALCQVVEFGTITNIERTKTMATVGTFVSGPISHTWNLVMEYTFEGSSWKRVAQKTLTNSVFAFCVSLPIMFTAVTLLSKDENGKRTKTFEDAKKKVIADLVPTFLAGLVYWPVFNVLVYRYIVVDYRAISNSLIGTVWNIYVSLMANRNVVDKTVEPA